MIFREGHNQAQLLSQCLEAWNQMPEITANRWYEAKWLLTFSEKHTRPLQKHDVVLSWNTKVGLYAFPPGLLEGLLLHWLIVCQESTSQLIWKYTQIDIYGRSRKQSQSKMENLILKGNRIECDVPPLFLRLLCFFSSVHPWLSQRGMEIHKILPTVLTSSSDKVYWDHGEGF